METDNDIITANPDRHPRCAHVFTKGPRAGQRCKTRVRRPGEADETPMCALHARPTCSICLDLVLAGTGVTTRCKHVFHRECLARVQADACPNCRAPLGTRRRRVQQAPDEHPLLVPLQVRVMHPAVVEMALTNAEAAARATTTTTTTAGPPPGAMMFVATLNGGDTEPDDGSSSDDEDRREVVTFRPPHEAFHEDLHYLIGAVGGRERLISILLDFF